MTERMSLDAILSEYSDGEEHGWTAEFAWIIDNQWPQTRKLIKDIAANGIRTPVLLGDDGRVWDGHHRLLAATLLRLPDVPVKRVKDDD